MWLKALAVPAAGENQTVKAWMSRASGGRAELALAVHIAQLFGSRSFGQVAAFLTIVAVARSLDPDAFGLYTFTFTLAALIAQIPGSGLDLSAVRVSARYWEHEPERARGVLLVAGAMKMSLCLGLALLLTALAGPLAALGVMRPELAAAIPAVALGAFALALSELTLSMLQAQERFGQVLVVNVLSAMLKLVPVTLLLVAGLLTLHNALVAFLAAAYLGALAGSAAVWGGWAGPARWGRATARELWDFSAWFFVATLLGTVTSSLDTLMLAQLAGPATVGLYSSGRTLALPLSVFGAAVGTVLLPRLGRLVERERIGTYVWQTSLRLVAAVTILCALLVAAAPVLLTRGFGPWYAPAVPVFQLLVLAYGVQVVIWPALTLLMVLNRTRAIAGLNLAMLLTVSLGYMISIPTLGAMGAALTLLMAYLLVLLLYILTAWRALREHAHSLRINHGTGEGASSEL